MNTISDTHVNIFNYYDLFPPRVSLEANNHKSQVAQMSLLEKLSHIKQVKTKQSIAFLDLPRTFVQNRVELKDYQQFGFSWLVAMREVGLGALLADDMGLGKTIQTIASIAYDVEQGNGSGPILIVAPNSLLDNWDTEFSRFAPNISVEIYRGRERNLNFAIANSKVVLTSYNLLRNDKELFQEVQWDGIILDEAQNIKNPEAQTTLVAKALHSKYRVALTGTPIENSIYDLWSLCDFLNPGMLGNLETFKNDYPDKSHLPPYLYERLANTVKPYLLRRLKSDHKILPDLPAKTEIKVHCTLTFEQKAVYQAIVENALTEMDQRHASKRGGLVLKLFTHLKQVCDDLNLYDMQNLYDPRICSGKFLQFIQIVDKIAKVKERVLIFTQYVEMAKLLKDYLDALYDQNTPILHGQMSQEERAYEINRFQNSHHDTPFFVLSLKAGGTGLNLTKANHVIHYDLWWNPAVEDQASDRAHRIGQIRNVTVHKLIVQNSVEEKIANIIENKRDIFQSILKNTEECSIEELRAFFSLTG
ncbi:MAG: DEAD/DEAH box helicase [Parachlamydiaceae bacterium]|nr:DEAD/DEAH box helicase [Parachlamydiaceae bacterium]